MAKEKETEDKQVDYFAYAAAQAWEEEGTYAVENYGGEGPREIVDCTCVEELAAAMERVSEGSALPRVNVWRMQTTNEKLRAIGIVLKILALAIKDAGGTVSIPKQEIWARPWRAAGELYLDAEECGALDICDEDLLIEANEQAQSGINLVIGGGPLPVEAQAEVARAYRSFDPETISAEEAASMLGVTRGRISQMLASGELAGIKVRGRTRVCLSSVKRKIK